MPDPAVADRVPSPLQRLGAEIARASRFGAPAAIVVSVASFAQVVTAVSHELIGPDNSLLWYAAPEWAHLRLHEPGFYGQSYGSTFNAIPVAILHALGTELAWAVPASLALSILTMWFALGWAAGRRGHPTVAMLAYAGPALLSSYYIVFVTTVPVERAFALVGVGAALLLIRSRRPWVTAVGACVLGVGVAIDASSLVLVAPIAVWFVLDARFRTEIVPALVGLVPAAAYAAYRVWFYAAHPDFDLHGGLPVGPSFDNLTKSLGDPYPLFRLFALEVLREWWMPVAAGAVVLVLVVARRSVTTAIPALVVLLLVLYAISTPHAVDGNELFLPPARILMMVPFALWFLVFLVAETGIHVRGWVRPAITIATLLLAVVSFGERVLGTGTHDPKVVEHEALGALYGFERVQGVEQRCDAIERATTRTGAELVVAPIGGTIALACAGRSGNRLETLDVPFERRTWLLERAAHTPVRRLLVAPAPATLCAVARRRHLGCTRVGTAALVRVPRQPILNALSLLGIEVRPFGPDCVVDGKTCASGTDARLAFPRTAGTPPAPAARAAMAAAVRSFVSGRAAAVEPMPDAPRTARAVARRLRGAKVRLGAVRTTGLATAAGPVRIGGLRPAEVRAQFVRVDGEWRLARSTACEVATRLEVACTALLLVHL